MLNNFIHNYSLIMKSYPWVNTLTGLIYLIFAVWIIKIILKKVLLKFINNAISLTNFGKDKELIKNNAIVIFINIIPAIVVLTGITLVPGIPDIAINIIIKLCKSYIIFIIAMSLSAALNIAIIMHQRSADAKEYSIKGYIQLLKILISLIATVLIISILIGRSPLILLSGIGAIAAVLMLIFQDTLLSLAASIQISSSDMLKVGDSIEAPNLNADGEVIDIALHTVKIQNWDKTITTIPTRRFITDPFKNWRGMKLSGARGIKRAINFDQNSIRYLTEEEIEHLKNLDLLKSYLINKNQNINIWNEGEDSDINYQKLTNMGIFRAYVERYLRSHPGIHQEMTLIVRQLSAKADGLPVEVYCFANSTNSVIYEGIQADIFEHLIAISSAFYLKIFQNPT